MDAFQTTDSDGRARMGTPRWWLVLGVLVTWPASLAFAVPPLTIEVRDSAPGNQACLDATTLRDRVAHFGGQALLAVPVHAQIVMEGPADGQLRLLRDGRVLSLRGFAKLPEDCEDRRGAIALSLAVALEHATRANSRAVDGSKPRTTSPARLSRSQPTKAPPQDSELAQERWQSDAPLSADSAAAPTSTRDSTDINSHPGQARLGVDSAQGAMRPAGSQEAESHAGANRPDPRVGSEAEAEAENGLEQPISGATEDTPGDGAVRAQLSVGGRWQTGALPWSVVVGAIGLAVSWGDTFSVLVSGFGAPAMRWEFAGGALRGTPFGAELLGCASTKRTGLQGQLCLGAAMAASSVEARGFPDTRAAQTVFWAAAASRLYGRWPAADRLSLQLFTQLHLNLLTPELQIVGATGAAQASWLGAGLGADLVLQFD